VDWLIRESNWKVSTGFRPGQSHEPVPIQARHICLLFRRFVSFGDDMTRPYVQALEARGVPHLLVGGRSFHNRGEIETLRAALAAIEWPDDELSVFATLRGALFAIGDEELLAYRHQFGHFHPFRIPSPDLPAFGPIVEALSLLQRLHRARNHVSVATTISTLLPYGTRHSLRSALRCASSGRKRPTHSTMGSTRTNGLRSELPRADVRTPDPARRSNGCGT
jgi:ATP-dependent exoDNAse (exonuclease V) beta subunit